MSNATGQSTAPVADDYSRQIEKAIDQEPLDRVKCARVSGNYYRCNWWASIAGTSNNPAFDWGVRATHQVRKSRFLHVTMSKGELVIQEVSPKEE